MASEQWHQDNPKILSYAPKAVHQRLQEFSVERKTSVSKAVTLILEEYFELEPKQPLSSKNDFQQDAKLKNLKQEVENLTSKVAELTSQLSRSHQNKTESTQRDESPKPLTFQKIKINRGVAEPSDQTTSSDKTKDHSQERNGISDHSFKTSQDSPVTEEESIPVYKTTPMRSGLKKSRENDRMNSSKNQSGSSNQSNQFKGQGAPDNSPESFSEKLLGRFFSQRLSGSNKDSSSASRPALPPPSDP